MISPTQGYAFMRPAWCRRIRDWEDIDELEKRLAALHRQHECALEQSGRTDDPQQWRKTGGWLWMFEQDLQALLLAEMQVRLQPIMGLLQAAHNEKNGLTG